MAALTTLNITEKNANNSLYVTVKVNVTKEGVFTTTLSKEDVILEWNCSEMDANEIIDCMESAGYITPDDFIGVLD